ncbi:MAG: signal peptide peptidase SppA [Bacteroidota bacterium]|nr:signal peptide peptidase SppA [Bacteroidota bacterium]
MRQFFKMLFASMFGFIIGGILLVFIVGGIITASLSSLADKKVATIEDKSVLHITLGYPIPERTPNNPFAGIVGDADMVGLNDILANLKKAQSDPHIKGVLLEIMAVGGGWATAEEIRNAVLDFKKSGKFVLAYSEIYTNGSYYIATAADKIYLNPTGEMLFNGMFAQVHFFKKALDKLGIEMTAIKGPDNKYKSAVEPFLYDHMSAENREQVEVYLNSLNNHMLETIAQSRKMEVADVRGIANELKIKSAADAKNLKMVDELWYKDQLLLELNKRLGQGEKDKIHLVTMGKYANVGVAGSEPDGEGKIAIIYATGEINSGEGSDNSIGSDRISDAIRKARNDDKVKAIVLRINSPGGSSLASDIIWREVELTRQQKKPIVVSMGDVAASGGYYIAAPADYIFAQANTITGSIGVFGLIPNYQKLMNDKLGITSEGVKTGKYSDLGDMGRPMTAEEKTIYESLVNKVYNDFVDRVAAGRKKTKAEVDNMARGRVWTGEDALKIGLVDKIGGIDDAIKKAAELAKLKDYRIKVLPQMKNPLEKFLKNGTTDVKQSIIESELGEYATLYRTLKAMKTWKGVQARMMFDVEIR